jgi:hypothetical protein
MSRIAAHELFADGRVVTLPEPCEIGCDLDGALVRGTEMQRQRERTTKDARPVAAAEKVLEAGFDPRGLTELVVHLDAPAAGEAYPFGSFGVEQAAGVAPEAREDE